VLLNGASALVIKKIKNFRIFRISKKNSVLIVALILLTSSVLLLTPSVLAGGIFSAASSGVILNSTLSNEISAIINSTSLLAKIISNTGSAGVNLTALPTDYYLKSNGNLYIIMNSQNSTVSSGVSLSSLLNSFLPTVKANQKIVMSGDLYFSSTVMLPANLVIDFGSSNIYVNGQMQYLFDVKSNVVISGGFYHGNGLTSTAVRSYSCNNVTVQNGYFEGFTSYAGSVILLDIGFSHLVVGNIFDSNFGCWAIVLNDCGDSEILYNTINCEQNGSGIGVFSYTGGSYQNCEIAYNNIREWSDLLWHAVYIAGTPHTKIHDNICEDGINGGPILVKSAYTDIYNNYIRNTSCYGISLYQEDVPDANSPNGSRVFDNTIIDCTVGIALTATLSWSLGNISVFGNDVSSALSSSCAVLFDANLPHKVVDITIQENIFHDIAYGVRFGFWGSSPPIENVSVLSNTFKNILSLSGSIVVSGNGVNTIIAYNIFVGIVGSITDDGINTQIYHNSGI
jgi:hypothetical protein